MRPSLCIAACRMFGARLEDARTAAAIEILHNALLIHDDIEDGSEQRRGRPTLHRPHGVPLALNAGDMLSLTSLRPLLENRNAIGERLAIQVIEETEWTARECAEGQAMELGRRHDNSIGVSYANYVEMVLRKTCWLAAIFPIRVGVLIAYVCIDNPASITGGREIFGYAKSYGSVTLPGQSLAAIWISRVWRKRQQCCSEIDAVDRGYPAGA